MTTTPDSDAETDEAWQTRRWRSNSVRVFAAMDTMSQIAERILGIVGTDRVMNTAGAYIGDEGLSDLKRLEHATGLKLGGHAAYPDGHNVWQRDDQAGFGVYLTHEFGSLGSLAGFGINVLKWNAGTEAEVQARYQRQGAEGADRIFDRRADITYVEMHGRPGEPHRDDRIEILDWNTHGVLRHTIVTFVEPDYCDSGRVTEVEYVVLAYRDGPSMRLRYRDEPEVLARFAALDEASEAQREAQARDGIDFAWVAEEKITRERRSVR